jgi:hypothetical protein
MPPRLSCRAGRNLLTSGSAGRTVGWKLQELETAGPKRRGSPANSEEANRRGRARTSKRNMCVVNVGRNALQGRLQ